jgi:hypothetical protein
VPNVVALPRFPLRVLTISNTGQQSVRTGGPCYWLTDADIPSYAGARSDPAETAVRWAWLRSMSIQAQAATQVRPDRRGLCDPKHHDLSCRQSRTSSSYKFSSASEANLGAQPNTPWCTGVRVCIRLLIASRSCGPSGRCDMSLQKLSAGQSYIYPPGGGARYDSPGVAMTWPATTRGGVRHRGSGSVAAWPGRRP